MNRIMRNRITAERLVTLGAIGVAVFAVAAHAEVIVHDNRDGTFQWIRHITFGGSILQQGNYLDIRKPPTQSGALADGTLSSNLLIGQSSSSSGRFQLQTTGTSAVALVDNLKEYDWNGKVIITQPAREYQHGDFTDASHAWSGFAPHYFTKPFSQSFDGGLPLIADSAYLGVFIKTGTNTFNYGWILFENWTDPVMWAYETTPNEPIQIPVPAPAGAGICGLMGLKLLSRRCRRPSKGVA